MANKLKKIELTSVDMVRRGANQESFFRLFKSAGDGNFLKQFLDRLRKKTTDDTIAKDYTTFDQINDNRESEDKLWRYADALTCSIRSIRDDNDLDRDTKASMMLTSLRQFDEAMEDLIGKLAGAPAQRNEPVMAKSDARYDIIEEIESSPVTKAGDELLEIGKFNPYHDARGRFASANGATTVSAAGGGGKLADTENDVGGTGSPIKVNGPTQSKAFADDYLATHPEVAKEAEKYKNVLSDVQNFQKNHPDAEEGTYSAVTGELVNPTGGFAVTFHQNLSKDNPYGGYDSDTYAKMCAIAKNELGSKDVYIGFFGNAEVSFNCASKEQAMKFAKEHNQHSIFDCNTFETILNSDYDPTTNPIEGHE